MPDVIGMSTLEATGAIESAGHNDVNVQAYNDDGGGVVISSVPPAGACIGASSAFGAVEVTVTIYV
jgi:beta-lactam-binding protein with PASTA domain